RPNMLAYHTASPPQSAQIPIFHNGDAVSLAKGSYQGTIGVFLHLCNDPKWAEILEPNSEVRSHPVEWLQLRQEPTPTKEKQ
ncbi:MAG TPA: hypothetical protein VN776_11920, partial [Terracidiphilus sp.]|nr:hypothetical protein [Terracidiphilus sp.]